MSGDFVKIEQQTSGSSSGDIRLEKIIDDTLLIINNMVANYSIDKLEIDGNVCSNISTLDLGLNAINISDCIVNITSASLSVVIYTGDKITEKYFYVKDAVISSGSVGSGSSLDCSSLAGGEWISVSGNGVLGTNDFCVMKYEARNVIGVPTSQSANNPWVSINQTDAMIKCESLNTGTGNYHLITDAEWVTIARLAENDNTNWNSSVVGTGGMYRGNVNLNDIISCGSNSVLNASIPGVNCLVGLRNKRTLNISGNLIWDLSGNVWEWTSNTVTGDTGGNLGQSGWAWYQWTAISGHDSLEPLNLAFDSNNGIGQVFTGGQVGTTSYAFLRGGAWYNGAHAGAFALRLINGPSSAGTFLGFRCSFEP